MHEVSPCVLNANYFFTAIVDKIKWFFFWIRTFFKIDWLRIWILCLSGMTCLLVYYKNPTKHVGLVQRGHLHLIESKLFSPWFSWKIAHSMLNNIYIKHRIIKYAQPFFICFRFRFKKLIYCIVIYFI
jgi:hypothetical protein